MKGIQEAATESYGRLKNLKLVGQELGIPWQSVYVHLKQAGVAVTGDKARYGSDKDRLAAKAECEFKSLVHSALDNNEGKWQAKVDFVVGNVSVDVKASTLKISNKRCKVKRWAFSVKKQEFCADFIVCFCFYDSGYRLLLLPGEIVRKYQTISISEESKGKWLDYEIEPSELNRFFEDINKIQKSGAA
jgi:hypothetical protein